MELELELELGSAYLPVHYPTTWYQPLHPLWASGQLETVPKLAYPVLA